MDLRTDKKWKTRTRAVRLIRIVFARGLGRTSNLHILFQREYPQNRIVYCGGTDARIHT